MANIEILLIWLTELIWFKHKRKKEDSNYVRQVKKGSNICVFSILITNEMILFIVLYSMTADI